MENINIKDYILSSVEEETSSSTATVKKAKPKASYELVLNSGTDFIIQKKTARTTTSLVIIVSQKQYYLKNEISGEIKVLDLGKGMSLSAEQMVKFFCDMEKEDIDTNQLEWIETLPHSKKECESFLTFLGKAQDVLKMHILAYTQNEYEYYGYSSKIDEVVKNASTYKEIHNIFNEISIKDFSRKILTASRHAYSSSTRDYVESLSRYIDFVKFLQVKYGIQNMRDFISTYKDLPVAVCLPSNYTVSREMFLKYNFEYKSLRDYILFEALSQGYANDSEGIISRWLDTLNMEEMVYNKITEKYPKTLESLHNKLSYIVSRNREEYDKKKWDKIYNENKDTYYWDDARDYIVTMPETRALLNDEAMQQSNCVAGYFNNIINESCIVVFLRKKKTPDTSWVTVEIRGDKIVQAKLQYNRDIDAEARRALERYCEDKNLTMVI